MWNRVWKWSMPETLMRLHSCTPQITIFKRVSTFFKKKTTGEDNAQKLYVLEILSKFKG